MAFSIQLSKGLALAALATAMWAACSEDSASTQGTGASGPGGSGASGAQGGGGSGATGGGGSGATGGGGSGATGGGGGTGGSGDECVTNDDCRLFSSSCESAPCVCIPLPADDPDPPCNGQMIQCIEDPCDGKAPICSNGWCTVDGGAAGTQCLDDTECADGLKCCYPCGVPDCFNQCMEPDMMTGDCPMFP
jgi:hypothetical protein